MSHLPKPGNLRILVADDHGITLDGTVHMLRQQYPDAEILTAQTIESVFQQVEQHQPNLVVLDLALPEIVGGNAQTDTGIQMLRTLMQSYPTLNLTVQSANIKALIRVRPEIDIHQGGFTAVAKSLSSQDLLTRVDLALRGAAHTRDIGTSLEVRPEWLEVLRLAFHEGLNDQSIAERMQVSVRTIRGYWSRLYDVLGIYSEDGKSLRFQTERRAREAGLID